MDSIEAELLKNINGEKGSLVYGLHEENVIAMEAFKEFCLLAERVVVSSKNGDCQAKTVVLLYAVYSLIWKYIACHFDANDGYRISNLTPELYGEIVEELDTAFDSKSLIESIY